MNEWTAEEVAASAPTVSIVNEKGETVHTVGEGGFSFADKGFRPRSANPPTLLCGTDSSAVKAEPLRGRYASLDSLMPCLCCVALVSLS